MAKPIIVVEGKNDMEFVCILLSKFNKNLAKIKTFDNVGNKKEKKYKETDLIRKLMQKSSPIDTLIKAENGKSNVFSLICSIMSFIISSRELKLYVIFDHDYKNPSDDINDLINRIRTRIKETSIQITMCKEIINNHLFEWELTITTAKSKRVIIIYTFKKSLEFSIKFDKKKRATLNLCINQFIKEYEQYFRESHLIINI